MVCMLQKLIFEKKYFNLESLNAAMAFFNYGVDAKNKPSNITRSKLVDDHTKNLHQNGKLFYFTTVLNSCNLCFSACYPTTQAT